MMNQAVKAEWVAALRSGEYEQATGHLYYEGSYCCLGVLCDLAVKRGVVSMREGVVTRSYGELDETAVPPHEVLDWAGLDYENPQVLVTDEDGSEQYPTLITLNDDEKYSFNRIADLIEEQL